MRRHGRSVHRKRIETVNGEPDALGLALPGLACGILAIALVLYAGTARRVPGAIPLLPIAAVGSGTVGSGTVGSGTAGTAPLASGSLAHPDSSSLAVLTSALRSDRP